MKRRRRVKQLTESCVTADGRRDACKTCEEEMAIEVVSKVVMR